MFGIFGKKKNKEDEQIDAKNENGCKELEVVVEVGDFIIKDNSIQEALGERFFTELKGNILHLSCEYEDECSSITIGNGSQVVIGNNICVSGRNNVVYNARTMENTIYHGRVDSSSSGCSVSKMNGVEFRNY